VAATYCALFDRRRISFHATSHNGRQSLTGLIMICTIAGEWLSQFSSCEPWLYYIQSLKFETSVLKWVILKCWSPKHWDTAVSLKRWEFCPLPQNIMLYICRIMEPWTRALCQVIVSSLDFDTTLDCGLTPMFQRNIPPPFSGWQLLAYTTEVAKQLIVFYHSVAASCVVDPGCFLVSIRLYLLPQYDD
jgi:hypothetical protein